ncbi:putative odorant receptor 85d [Aethina tumida]|uniref:putative odorant receptor 85d n=1 Tax=Aethina tumida TaxID=116153 RepID=UPI002149161F|nr:putative odorant receptor 85d [Aethina tumida]
MILSGIWRLPLKTKSLQSFYDKYSILFQLYFYAFVLSMAIAVGVVWKYSIDTVVECLSISILCSIVSMKTVVCQTESIKRLLRYILAKEDELKRSTDEESKRICIEHQNVAYFMTKLITSSTATVGTFLLMTKFLLYWNMERHQTYPNVTMYRKKPLPYITWLPFNSDDHYISAFSLHSIAAFIGTVFNSVTAIFYLTCMIFICCRLRILQHRIKTMGTSMHQPELVIKTVLNSLIVDHQTIIEYTEQFNNDINLILLVDFTLNSVQVASIFFQLVTLKLSLLNLVFLTTYFGLTSLQIFSSAWFANEIKEQSLGVADAICEHNWHEQSLSIQKTLMLMMTRAQKPLTLTVGPFSTMSNNTPITIMKASYSYVTLMTSKRE